MNNEKKKFIPKNKTVWYPDEIVFLIQEFDKYTNPQLLEILNSKRSKKLTMTVLRNKLYSLKLYHQNKPQEWSERETSFLINNYKKLGNVEIAKRLNRYKNRTRFFTVRIIWKKMKLLKLKRTERQLTNIRQIHVINGLYTNPRCGEAHHLYRKEGEKWIRKHGKYKYWFIKVDGKILFLHRYRYQKILGPIIPGNMVSFKDGDTTNCKPENLYQCKRGKHSVRKNKVFDPHDPFLSNDKVKKTKSFIESYKEPIFKQSVNY